MSELCAEPDAIARIQAAVPPAVRRVCETLAAAGHQAVTVGGAVRDVLLGRVPGDWDVATSAPPAEVMALFPRTIPTGLAHGTVSVLVGPKVLVEVTTFRGEGVYLDARRPSEVTFGVPLVEDLARRDLVVNAMAFDPVNGALIDPFGGMADLRGGVIRAVGDPVARFVEDGLRVVRAVRFAASLEFAIAPETQAALRVALPSLAKVARERVAVEVRKLLATPRPSRGLGPAWEAGIIDQIAPALGQALAAPAMAQAWQARVDGIAATAGAARLAGLLTPWLDTGAPLTALEAWLRQLTFSNAECADTLALLASLGGARQPKAGDGTARRALASLRRERLGQARELWQADDAVRAAASGVRLADQMTRLARDPLYLNELAVTGHDVVQLLAQAGHPAGRRVGEVLAAVLEAVLDTPEAYADAASQHALAAKVIAQLPASAV